MLILILKVIKISKLNIILIKITNMVLFKFTQNHQKKVVIFTLFHLKMFKPKPQK
jgi:hypothetical protein